MTNVSYRIKASDLAAHLFEVSITIATPAAEGQIFSLPVWIPGSYMVREFARNIVQIKAHSKGKKVALKKLDKSTWRAAPCEGTLQLEYQVYAWDLSVRAAHLDQSHGFFNGTSVFLCAQGLEHLPHVVDIQAPDDRHADVKKWRVATALPELKAKRYGFGTYIAANYDELIDHPVEMGDFQMISFKAHGVPHDFVVTGRVPNLDLPRIAKDLQQICEAQIAFFEPRSKQAPMSRYVFMTMAVGDGYGGLEHRASTALICNRSDLPVKHKDEMSEGYRSFLGLCSHEYFHTWNVKRIKPAAFAPYDLNQENYTRLLWLFEGFTSYYDDLFLCRTGLIDEQAYFKLVAKTINLVQRGSGRKKQSVAESSFDAWTKYYRQDENSPNAIVSYYTKGSLVALGLDLLIRAETQGKKSLDDVMRSLWKSFGKDFYAETNGASKASRGLDESGFVAAVMASTGVDVSKFVKRYVDGVEDVPLADLYRDFGVNLDASEASKKAALNVRLSKSAGDCKIAAVYENGAAHRAGLSAGDVVAAINGLRVTASDVDNSLSNALAPYRIGDTIRVHAFRRDELMECDVKLQADDVPSFGFKLLEAKSAKAKARLKRPSQDKR